MFCTGQQVHWCLSPRRLQGRLGGVVIRPRSTNAQEDFHEVLIVAFAPLENADSDLLSLLWLTLSEWNLAPPRRSNTIIMTDANGRTGFDHAQAANHDRNTDWHVVGGSFSENTTANGREMVNLCEQAGLCLGNTWRNGEPTTSLGNEQCAAPLQDAESQPVANVPAGTDEPSVLIRTLSHTLHALLATLTTGRSLRLVQRAPNRNGFEVWAEKRTEDCAKIRNVASCAGAGNG